MPDGRVIKNAVKEQFYALIDKNDKAGASPWVRVNTLLPIWTFTLKSDQPLSDTDVVRIMVCLDDSEKGPDHDGVEGLCVLNPQMNWNFSGIGYNFVKAVREKDGPPITVLARFMAGG